MSLKNVLYLYSLWVLPSDKFCDDNCVTMGTQNYYELMNVLKPLK